MKWKLNNFLELLFLLGFVVLIYLSGMRTNDMLKENPQEPAIETTDS